MGATGEECWGTAGVATAAVRQAVEDRVVEAMAPVGTVVVATEPEAAAATGEKVAAVVANWVGVVQKARATWVG